jgi:hypothetical protein
MLPPQLAFDLDAFHLPTSPCPCPTVPHLPGGNLQPDPPAGCLQDHTCSRRMGSHPELIGDLGSHGTEPGRHHSGCIGDKAGCPGASGAEDWLLGEAVEVEERGRRGRGRRGATEGQVEEEV